MLNLKEFIPEQLLFQKDRLQAKIVEFEKANQVHARFEKARATLLSVLVSLFSLTLSAPSLSSIINKIFQNSLKNMTLGEIGLLFLQFISIIGIIAICAGSIISTIVAFIAKRRTKGVNLYQDIVNEVMDNINYTGIILIANCDDQSSIRFLLGRHEHEENQCFFPYVKMNPDSPIDDQYQLILNHVTRTYDLTKGDIIEIKAYNEQRPFHSIKKIANHDVEEHLFVFFSVKFNYNVKRSLFTNKRDSWAAIEDMINNPLAMAYNRDVINYVHTMKDSISDSFISISHPLKVVWNITQKCNYNCAICATQDRSRSELDYKSKTEVLYHLASLKDRIAKIDFSGGDPCISNDDLMIIKSAIGMFGASKISVTTTGKGIIYACQNPENEIVVKNCEITIDALGDSSSIQRDSESQYYDDNIRGVIENITHIRSLVINMPIMCNELSNAELGCLIRNITVIKQHGIDVKVNLLRLMPVGGMSHLPYPKDYNPTKAIQQIVKELRNNGIDVTAHCSLKVTNCLTQNPRNIRSQSCNMAMKKVGIDCAGNVFACGWSGYLPNKKTSDEMLKPEENPFFLGNAYNTQLSLILSTDNKKFCELMTRISRSLNRRISFCPVISYMVGNQWYQNNDPLT